MTLQRSIDAANELCTLRREFKALANEYSHWLLAWRGWWGLRT